MLLDLNHHSFADYKKEFIALATLALPMFLSQIAQVGTGFIDTLMAGSISKDDLSAVGLGNSLFITIYITLLGVMTALNPLIAQQYGAINKGETKAGDIGELGRQGLWYGLLMGVIGMVLIWAAILPFDYYFDHLSANTLTITKKYLYFIGLAMPAAMIHRTLHAYASSLNKPKVIMMVSWLCFFVMPALGGAGCGLATAIVFWLNAIMLGTYIAKDRYFHEFGLMDKFSLPDIKLFGDITKLGIPIGLSFFIEVSLFSCIMFLVARLDGNTENYIAAQQIAINITSLIFMIPQSLGIASTVRVGMAMGQREPKHARYSSGVALSGATAISFLTAAFLVIGREQLATLYTKDTAVIAITTTIILYAAAFQLVDAIQCVASYALRGYKITTTPMIIHIIAFWGCGLLPGIVLAFYVGMGIYGFWMALVISLAVAALSLGWYLERHSKYMTKQIL